MIYELNEKNGVKYNKLNKIMPLHLKPLNAGIQNACDNFCKKTYRNKRYAECNLKIIQSFIVWLEFLSYNIHKETIICHNHCLFQILTNNSSN